MVKNYLFALCLLAISSCSPVYAKEPESFYQQADCAATHGVAEYRNVDGTRTDCLTRGLSIEYDFPSKWYECITQAMHYAMLNGNAAVCRLIVITSHDEVLFKRALIFNTYYRLPVVIQKID